MVDYIINNPCFAYLSIIPWVLQLLLSEIMGELNVENWADNISEGHVTMHTAVVPGHGGHRHGLCRPPRNGQFLGSVLHGRGGRRRAAAPARIWFGRRRSRRRRRRCDGLLRRQLGPRAAAALRLLCEVDHALPVRGLAAVADDGVVISISA